MNAQGNTQASLALVGNPNCGKTALFNALTGGRQKVANYAGVTVERKHGTLALPDGRRLRIMDLPGTYSLRSRSPDEAITRDAVLGRLKDEAAPDLVICVVDATNLRLGLRLALELKLVGRPMVLVLNMIDIVERRGIEIDLDRLSLEVGFPVITTVATRKRGLDAFVRQASTLIDAPRQNHQLSNWSAPTPHKIRQSHLEASRIVKACVKPPVRPDTWTSRIDSIMLHPVAGLAILLALLFLIFQAVFSWATPAMDVIEAGFAGLSGLINQRLPAGLLQSFLTDGVISGVGSVLVFLPQILILFFFILLLEDSGYMARAAFLMDKIMGGVGLHGRAFIPLLSSFACAIPGIMATRVIDGRRDRLTVIMIAPLMTCSARIPVYTLIISAFIPNRVILSSLNLRGIVMFGLYAGGIITALMISFVARKVLWRGSSEPFMMELPTYKLPSLWNIGINLLLRAKVFLRRAGVIILPLMVVVWGLSSFPSAPNNATLSAIDYSVAGVIGHAVAPAFLPIGFNWQMTVALIPGLAAREVAVAALGTVYALSNGGTETKMLATALADQWSLASGLSFLVWYVFAPQCMATFGIVKRETNTWRWPIIMTLYMAALAYIASFVTYQLATFLGG